MTAYKLTYFDIDGGRAEPVRIAFHAAGIEFEDVRIAFPEFAEMRGSTRFNSVPVLEIDGAVVTQTNGMCRYVGRMAGLYPQDAIQGLYCDEALGAIEELLHRLVPTFALEGDELKAAREKLVAGSITTFVKGLAEILERGGDYIADNKLTVADLKVAYVVQWLNSGQLDHIPADLVERLAPALNAHAERTMSDPIVTSYYEARSQ